MLYIKKQAVTDRLGHKLEPGRTDIAKARKAIKNYLYGDLPF